MKMVALAVRIVLGLEFLVFGLNGFLHFIPQPRMPPSDVTTFFTVLMTSHYIVPVAALEVVGGALLLIGRFVPLGLTLLGPVVVNIVLVHLLLEPKGRPIAALTALLWLVLFVAYRKYFACIFTPDAVPS